MVVEVMLYVRHLLLPREFGARRLQAERRRSRPIVAAHFRRSAVVRVVLLQVVVLHFPEIFGGGRHDRQEVEPVHPRVERKDGRHVTTCTAGRSGRGRGHGHRVLDRNSGRRGGRRLERAVVGGVLLLLVDPSRHVGRRLMGFLYGV